jgi:16S rRNA (guanine527-N7)-methyltransferase
MSASVSDAEALEALAARYGLDRAAIEHLDALWERLATDPRAPTAVRERRQVLDRHIADSLSGLELEAVKAARVIADLGSGAGLPGLVLAASSPGAQVRAVESQQSKCAYIASLAAAAGLRNVRVVCSRAEDWRDGLEDHDVVTARALAAQPVVLEYGAPLLALGGHLVDWRGRRDRRDEARALAAAAQLGLERLEVRAVRPFPEAEDRHLHVFVKRAATPQRFPRRTGVASKRPLGG